MGLVAVPTVTATVAGAAVTCTSVCFVSPAPAGDDTNSGQSDSPFATIQHAVITVSSGGTVNVGAGAYSENVLITQPLTLAGANAQTPAPGLRGAESVITSSGGGNNVNVQVAATNVTVDGFTLLQNAPVICDSCAAFGVQVDPGSNGAAIANNIIDGMTTSGTYGGTQAGPPIGILVSGNGSMSPTNVTIAGNLIENITSLGTQHKSAQGILIGTASAIGPGTGLVIQSNHITNVNSAAWGAYGVNINRGGGTTGALVQGNTIDTLQGKWAHAIGLEGPTPSVTVANNLIGGITTSPPSQDSADVFTDSTNNAGITSATITQNSFGGGTSAGIITVSSGALTATGNFWGCSSGPNTPGCSAAGAGPGGGALNLTPWIASATPDPAKAGQPGYWPTAIVGGWVPTITSAQSVQVAQSKKLRFTVTTGGYPAATISTAGLPSWVHVTLGTWLHVAPGTGHGLGNASLTGVAPAGGGTYPFTIHANNGIGLETTQVFTIYVLGISSPAAVSFSKAGGAQSFTILTTGASAGVTLSATLGAQEAGLTFQDNGNGTATVFGTPVDPARTYVVKITAHSGAATTTQRLAIGITS
jgi:hypothetical protein